MNPSQPDKNLPLLLVIGNPEENWYDLCKDYADKFTVEQATFEEISLSSYSDKKGAIISLAPSKRANCPRQKVARFGLTPSLVLIRMLSRYIGGHLGSTPDYRNILYGLYHSNTPIINGYEAVMAELERPIMYGRLRAIRDKFGEEIFPLIQQYYYPEYSQVLTPPPEPFVLKVGFPHAGFGKIRVFDRDQLEDIKSIIAISNNYSTAEPLIDAAYELRIVFIAPDYYRVHKRTSPNWKVNFGLANIREDCEMNPRYKRWVDLVYQAYPDLLTFDIDAIVDKNGKEYILEVNGSSQGFAPEHGQDDLQHMKELVIRKLESVTNTQILEQRSPVPLPFELNNSESDHAHLLPNESTSLEEKEIEIINLKNKVESLQREVINTENKCQILLSNDYTPPVTKEPRFYQVGFFIGSFLLVLLASMFFYRKVE